jgi:AraC-like DNA-binding protein
MRYPIVMSEMIVKGVRQSYIMADENPALAASGIHMVGHGSIFDRDRKRPMDKAGHWLLQTTVSGEGQGLVNGRWVGLPARTAYIVPRGAEWTWRYQAKTKTPWEQLFVVLRPEFRISVPVAHDTAYTRRDCDPTDLLWAFQGLYRESLAMGRPAIMTALSDVIACLARELLDDEEHHYQLSDLWMTVANDLTRPWNIAALCEEKAMSQEKLRLLCHKETAKSPMVQVTYLRMRYAADLLVEGDLNVQQIGFLVGYENPFNFSLAFKRLYGLSPTHFRKEQATKR